MARATNTVAVLCQDAELCQSDFALHEDYMYPEEIY